MAIGFGFNKAKVLSSAEKFVQQGKLQNAITEYEKVIREDPKDLTVLNTIGDLYARVGQNDKAADYFRRVGDQYAQNGFVVKAIAIYKKLTKLVPPTAETTLKLAELYTQQGLFNDARTYYMQVANQLLKTGDNNQAAKILQKVLELDPENAVTQSKLADLYMKLGKNDEARSIYFSAAQSLYARSSFEAADEALGKVLTLDPSNVNALLLRGAVAADAGNPDAAIKYLEQLPNLDAQPNALRTLLRAKLITGNLEGVEEIADKLLADHQDMGGVNSVAEWYLQNQQWEEALKFYGRYAERFLARGPAALLDVLHPLIGRVKNSPPALQIMLRLLQDAGDTSHVNEVIEMLAHAHVQSGDFVQARDTYKRLGELEPENPLHLQNFRQMQSKLGEDSMYRPLSAEQGSQAFMVEELVHEAPELQQSYAPAVERAIEAALTDSELFVSYNVPSKAIAPLEAALTLAPRDVHLNQRLATLYAKAERFKDAAHSCRLLSEVYAEFGHAEESARYAEAAENYSPGPSSLPARAAPSVVPPPPVLRQPPVEARPAMPPIQVASDTSTVQEFDLNLPMDLPEIAEAHLPQEEVPAPAQMAGWNGFEVVANAGVMQAPEEVVAPPPAEEIDLSGEWEKMIAMGPEMVDAPPAEETHQAVAAPAAAADPAVVADKVQEIHFYISQGFWDIAHSAINDLAEIAPNHPDLERLSLAVTAAQARAEELLALGRKPAPVPTPKAVVPAMDRTEPAPAPHREEHHEEVPVEEMRLEEVPLDEARFETVRLEEVRLEEVRLEEVGLEDVNLEEIHLEEVHLEEAPAARAPLKEEHQAPTLSQPPAPPIERVQDLPDLGDLVLDLSEDFGEIEIAQAPPAGKAPAPPVTEPRPAAATKRPPAPMPQEEPSEDVLANFVLDLEESLGGDFSIAPQNPPAPQPRASIPAPPRPMPAMASAASTNGQMQDAETALALSDILTDLQHDIGEDEAATEEDPETHYNLGIAFKEMGLLDEAIGELQKVCHALDRGSDFAQPIQAYTWLAQCLVDKGVPEAAVRWYERALKTSGLDLDSRCSIYYDLGAAHEASGDRKAALTNFMEVYSTNIDFRDVATRIKALKS
ncbi:MAG TPA: tetratricopeptide repeat protein [Candidatus Saccharimonadales bacterium]|jgi:tetratricopeptide (TPR) repeat protein|nr:tetratricopeptide repeat protein [Candidatus Saccharimonadales bacterium]